VLMLRNMLKTDDEQEQRAIYEQVCDQEFSHIPEVLDGETRTHFEFVAQDGRLYVMQPNGVVDWLKIHENGVIRARKKAEANPRLGFYATIAEAEMEEAKAQINMAEDGRPATMLVISLDGSDLGSSSDLKKMGRDPEKKRAYLRASVFDNGRLHLYSATSDGVEVGDAKRILERFGSDLPPGADSIDVLKTRVMLDGAHRNLLEQIMPVRGDNNYDFVLKHEDLLACHMKNLINLAQRNLPEAELACEADELRYDTMSSFKQQLEGTWLNLGDLGQSVSNAGMIERNNGTQFAGCDVALTSQLNNLHEAGYLNTQGLELFNLLKKEFESKWCPNCLPKPQAGKSVKAWRRGDRIGCGTCGHVVDICTKKVVRQGKKQRAQRSFLDFSS